MSTVHIPVHVQNSMMPILLGESRKKFPQSIRDFVDALEPDVKTTWALLRGKLPRTVIPYSKSNEGIFVGESADIFDDGKLGRDLREQNVQSIILTGLMGPACVAASLNGALRENFHCIVIPNLIADGSPERDNRNAPEDHARRVQYLTESVRRNNPQHIANVEFVNSGDYLQQLKIKPAPPSWTAPAFNLELIS